MSFFKKKTKNLSETAPTHTVHETGLNIFNETYFFLGPLGILKWQCLWGQTSCTGLLLHQVWAEGQAVIYKLWWPGFCLCSLFLHSLVLSWNGYACTEELTVPTAFVLISWHSSIVTTLPVLKGLTSQISPLLHLIASFSTLITTRFHIMGPFYRIFTDY